MNTTSIALTASSLTRAGSTFAAASDNVVRFVSAGRWQTMAVECRGPPALVSDVVFDPLRPELVHVAYETGVILTFRKPPVYDMTTSCKKDSVDWRASCRRRRTHQK